MMTDFQAEMLNRGLFEIANALRELAAAVKGPQPEPELGYRCENCGSPKWNPGGQCDMFKVCSDCGNIGEKIDAA